MTSYVIKSCRTRLGRIKSRLRGRTGKHGTVHQGGCPGQTDPPPANAAEVGRKDVGQALIVPNSVQTLPPTKEANEDVTIGAATTSSGNSMHDRVSPDAAQSDHQATEPHPADRMVRYVFGVIGLILAGGGIYALLAFSGRLQAILSSLGAALLR
jgi:hypothetical protein